jgi:hypothetical protein
MEEFILFCHERGKLLSSVQQMIEQINNKLYKIATSFDCAYKYFLEFDAAFPFDGVEWMYPGFLIRVIREEDTKEGELDDDTGNSKQIVCDYAFSLHKNTKSNDWVSHYCHLQTFSGTPKEGMFQKSTAGKRTNDGSSKDSSEITFRGRGWAELLFLVKHWIGSKLDLEMRENYIHPAIVKLFDEHHRDKPDQQIDIVRDASRDLKTPDMLVNIPPTEAMQTYTQEQIEQWIRNVASQKASGNGQTMTYASNPNPYLISLDTQKWPCVIKCSTEQRGASTAAATKSSRSGATSRRPAWST